MFSYLAYGLGIRSNLPLPDFHPAEAGCDVAVRFERTGTKPSEIDGQALYVRVTKKEAVIAADDLGVFLVRDGREVTVMPAAGDGERASQLYVAGTAMAIVLFQRGRLALHASAVAVGGKVVAFLGEPGAGKSSLAAALHARGHDLVADDVTAVDLTGGRPLVFPAFPQLKLMPAAAAAVGCDEARLSVLYSGEEKRAYRLSEGFSQDPLPCRQLYLLTEGSETAFELVRPQEAVLEFVRHSYPTRMLQPGGASHFLQCARLARAVPVYRLRRARSLPLLRDLAIAVEEHVAYTAPVVTV